MKADIISGKILAEKIITEELIPRVDKLKEKNVIPSLVVILIGENSASESYVRQKEKFAKKAGIKSEVRRFTKEIKHERVLQEIKTINQDETIHGLIVQLPLPPQIKANEVIETIDPKKDVDGFTAENIGKLTLGEPCLECCTPKGIVRMIESKTTMEGKNVVVVGRSNIVGKPVALLCANKHATVTICHSKTKNLEAFLQTADIVIVAVGKPKFLKAGNFRENCIVIDVGIHRQEDGTLCGDVDFESVAKKVSAISPVPGGVGPMTVVSLIENTVEAAERSE